MTVSIPDGPMHDFIDPPDRVQNAQAYALEVLVNNLLRGCGRAVLEPAESDAGGAEEKSGYTTYNVNPEMTLAHELAHLMAE